MKIDYRQVNPNQTSLLFPLFEKYMREVIEASVGWDGAFQREGFESKLNLEWFRWIYIDEEPVGLLCLQQKMIEDYLYLIILYQEYQGKGLAKAIMFELKTSAEKRNLNLAWSCLSNNKTAQRLYDALPNVSKTREGLFYRYVWR